MKKNKIIALVALLIASISWVSCETEVEPLDPAINLVEGLPVITTVPATNTTANAASSGGVIASDEGYAITERGVVWGTTSSPTTANSKTVDGTGIGSFVSSLTGLTANTTYYVRAYATNSQGTAYGNQILVSTLAAANLPVLTTSAITNNTAPNARSGGNITADGGSAIIDRGVVWGVSPNPVVSSTRTTHDATGMGSFTSQITPTLPGTTYYVRAYAKNVNGISYGNQVTFVASVGSVDTTPALMTANIDGVQYNSLRPFAYSIMHNDINVENDGAPAGDPRFIWIQGTDNDVTINLTNSREIDLHISDSQWAPGTYPLLWDNGYDQPVCWAKLLIFNTPDVHARITTGTLTVTEFNRTTRRIKGTFSFDYEKIDAAGNVIGIFHVTNGTFNYGLDDSYFD